MSVRNMWGDRCMRSKGNGLCIYTHWSSLMSQPCRLLAQVGLLICMGYLSCDKCGWTIWRIWGQDFLKMEVSICSRKIRVHKWEPPEESWDLLPDSRSVGVLYIIIRYMTTKSHQGDVIWANEKRKGFTITASKCFIFHTTVVCQQLQFYIY